MITNGHYTKWSQELRVTTPQQYPVKGTVGLFAQRQVHEIWEHYVMPGARRQPLHLQPPRISRKSLTIPTLDNNSIWLTDEQRVDRDTASVRPGHLGRRRRLWSLTGGIRDYHYDNSLQGFYGYSANYQAITGYCLRAWGPAGRRAERRTPTYAPFHFAPCTDLNTSVSDKGHTEAGDLKLQDRSRSAGVLRRISTGLPAGRREPRVRHRHSCDLSAVPGRRAEELRDRLEDAVVRRDTCAGTARCSGRTGTTSSSPTSGRTA